MQDLYHQRYDFHEARFRANCDVDLTLTTVGALTIGAAFHFPFWVP